MANVLKMKVATAESLLVDSDVTALECRCSTGHIGVLPGHAPLVSAIGGPKTVKLSDGFIYVLDNSIRVLADSAELS